MNLPRSDTKIFAVLECFINDSVMEVEQAIKAVKNITWRDSKADATRLLRTAVQKNYLVLAFGKYRLSDEIKPALLKQVEAKREANKKNLVPAPYRNIWAQEMQGYTASLYRNKRGYEGRYK